MSISRRGRTGRVSATEAAKTFGRLIDRVREERTTYVIERSGIPVARVGPAGGLPFTIGDFKRILAGRRPDDEYLRALGAAADRHTKPRVRRNPWER